MCGKDVGCHHCGKKGHFKHDCYKWKKKKGDGKKTIDSKEEVKAPKANFAYLREEQRGQGRRCESHNKFREAKPWGLGLLTLSLTFR